MSRCAEDSVFNRVLCVTLLATAVTFTVILTNVFVDIDDLLTNKTRETGTVTGQEESSSGTVTLVEVEGNPGDVIFKPDRLEMYGTDDTRNDLVDGETARTRRSLDTPNTFKNNAKLRKLLTHRLETLLEELDSDKAPTTQITTTVAATEDHRNDIDTGEKDENELLKIAMHNILLDGVINHIELNTIYAEVHKLVQCLRQIGRKKADVTTYKKRGEEYDLIEEMAKCEDIRDHDNGFSAARKERKKIFIKTTVDIITDDAQNQTMSENDVKGEVQIIFNGKPIKSTSEKEERSITTEQNEANSTISGRSNRNEDKFDVSSNFLQPFMRQYLKKYSKREISVKPIMPETNTGYKSKRMKRHIKLRFNDKKQEKTHYNPKVHKEKQEDEVFVEIKTHFNNKGIKGAKKKKLIKALIKKIEKAIHADLDQSPQTKKSMIVKQWNIKKRTQDPLEKIKSNTHAMSLDKIFRRDSKGQREINPITKEVFRNGPLVSDSNGNPWRSKNDGPGFLAASKSINSAETGLVDVDYNKVLSVNGIPKRLQKPLTTDDDEPYEDFVGPETYVEHGIQNYKFLIKNIDGTGFSIGLNSYIDGAPEPEAIKMFSSLENLINAFQNTYKRNEDKKNTANEKVDGQDTTHLLTKRETNQVKSHENGHVNYYGQDIYKNRALRYHNYQEILDRRFKRSKERITPYSSRSKSSLKIKQRKRVQKPIQFPVLLDEQILNKDLTPSDILGIANLLSRKKRHMELKTVLNRKSNKNKRLKYFNRKPLKRRIIYKNKRNKRQIRFIKHRKGDDIFGSSEKNTYADRAFLNGANNDALDTDIMKADDNFFKMDDSPRLYNRERIPGLVIRAHPSKISSLYPHIFLSEKVKYEDENPELRDFTDNQPELKSVENNEEVKESEDKSNVSNTPVNKNEKLQDFEELVKSIIPPSANRKFKVIVKVKPTSKTNGTEVTGFKEVHTSINKSFNKDGLQYFTLVNVSQISKIEKLNTTDTVTNTTTTTKNKTSPLLQKLMDKEHDTMKSLLQYQKDAINTQLRNLQKENSRIDSIIAKNLKNRRAFNERFQFQPADVTTTTEVTTKKETTTMKPIDTPKPHLSADEISNIVKATIKKFQLRPKAETRRRAETPVTVLTTATTTTTSKPDVIANILLTNINLTTQVLKKIDKNTELLANFLSKLHTRKESYIRKEYPTRRAVNMQHTKSCTHPDHDSLCSNNNLDPIIDKRSIVSTDKPTVNTILNPTDSVVNNFSRSDQEAIQIPTHLGFVQRIGTESNSRLNKFFIDVNKPRVIESSGIIYNDKIISSNNSENLNITNPLFQ